MKPVEAQRTADATARRKNDGQERPQSWRDRPLVLVGLMGSGKSTIGKRLAAHIGWPFVDADSEIEKAAKMSIAEIFERFGEPHFRDGERRILRRLMESGRAVIATGGGAFVDDGTRALILEKGTAIWLDADIDTLVRRVTKRTGRSLRPLLHNRDPQAVLEDMREKRVPSYREAHIHITSTNGPHEETVTAILAALDPAPEVPAPATAADIAAGTAGALPGDVPPEKGEA